METENTATTVESGEGIQAPAQTEADTVKPFIVGANSVYKDVASLFEGAKQKEAYIQTLLSEKRQLEEQMKALTNINKFQEDLNKMEQQPTEVTQPTSQLTEEKVQELALKALQQQQAAARTEANLKTVSDTLAKVFGAEAENKIEAKCKELGISKDFGMSVAKDSPKAFLKMMGLDEPTTVSVETLMGHGRIADTQQAVGAAPATDMERLMKDPSLTRNRTFLQNLFKNPQQVLSTDTEWKVIG